MPFTQAQFFQVFRDYNLAIWPMQAVLFLLAIGAVVAALSQRRGVASLVAALWVWCGVAYHVVFFTRVNVAAWVFGFLFVAAAAVMVRNAAALRFGDAPPLRLAAGLIFIIYALIVYPIVGYFAGHLYPAVATFGAPCPLTIFTIGLLIMSKPPLPLSVSAIPVLWSFVGATAAFRFGMVEDLVLPIAGLTLLVFFALDRIAHVTLEDRLSKRIP